jgi:hypothetical protein
LEPPLLHCRDSRLPQDFGSSERFYAAHATVRIHQNKNPHHPSNIGLNRLDTFQGREIGDISLRRACVLAPKLNKRRKQQNKARD